MKIKISENKKSAKILHPLGVLALPLFLFFFSFNISSADVTVTSTYQGWLGHYDGVNNVPTNCHQMSATNSAVGFQQNTSTGILFLTHENSEADCFRGFVYFDLTGVNLSTVTGAEIIVQGGTGSGATPDQVNPNWASTDSGDGNWAVFGWTPSSTVSTQLTDFSSSTNGAVSSTFFSTASTTTSWQLNVTNTIPLNSDAITFIKQNNGAFVFRGSYDYNNAADNPANHTNFIQGYNLRLHLIQSGGGGGGNFQASTTLDFPTNNTSTPEFGRWVVDWTVSSTITTGSIGIKYGQNSSSLLFDDNAPFNSFVSRNPILINKTIFLNNIVLLNSTSSWYAQPYLTLGTTTYLGNVNHFTVDNNASFQVTTTTNSAIINPRPGSIITTPSNATSTGLTCNNILYDFVNCFINAGTGLAGLVIGPSPNTIPGLENDLTGFKSIFPFSIAFSIQNSVLATASSTNTNATSVNFEYKILNTTYDTPLINSSTLVTVIGQKNKDDLFNAISAILWAGWTYGIYHVIF